MAPLDEWPGPRRSSQLWRGSQKARTLISTPKSMDDAESCSRECHGDITEEGGREKATCDENGHHGPSREGVGKELNTQGLYICTSPSLPGCPSLICTCLCPLTKYALSILHKQRVGQPAVAVPPYPVSHHYAHPNQGHQVQ